MPEIFIGTPEQISEAHSWVKEIYKAVAKYPTLTEEEIASGNSCFKVSEEIIRRARQRGYDANPRNYFLMHGHVDLGNDWGIDAQWKQFLIPPIKRIGLPNVIIAPIRGIPQIVKSYGVKELRYWECAITSPVDPWFK